MERKPTFAGVSRLAQPSDITVVGIPWDGGSTGARGQAKAPGDIRTAGYDFEEGESLHSTITGVDLSDLSIVDTGDITWPENSDIASAYRIISDRMCDLFAHGDFVVVLGGDDGINYPIVRGLKDLHQQQITLVHFDAHRDTWFPQNGLPCDHGTWVRDLIEDGFIEGNVHQLGVRCYGPARDEWALYKDRITTYPPDISNSPHFLMRDIDGPVFIALDIDAIDPAFAPGTGFPEPGGFLPRDIMALLHLLVQNPQVQGLSITEVNPSLDIGNATARLANRLVLTAMDAYASRA
jgi:agmatinase